MIFLYLIVHLILSMGTTTRDLYYFEDLNYIVVPLSHLEPVCIVLRNNLCLMLLLLVLLLLLLLCTCLLLVLLYVYLLLLFLCVCLLLLLLLCACVLAVVGTTVAVRVHVPAAGITAAGNIITATVVAAEDSH